MLKIGLTGSIGSGKSVVAKMFETLEIPVYHADDEAKEMLHQKEVIKEITNTFGDWIRNKNKEIDRKKLAGEIFNNPEKLEILNGIIHPNVKLHFQEWSIKQQDKPYIVQEAAILFESGFNKLFDKIITVTSPELLRIKRVMKRDNISRKAVMARINNQWPDDFKVKHADFVITNDEKQLIIPQALKIHNELIAIAKASAE